MLNNVNHPLALLANKQNTPLHRLINFYELAWTYHYHTAVLKVLKQQQQQ